MPALMASLALEKRAALPLIQSSPESGRVMPNSARATSVRPLPTRPPRPRISPLCSVRLTASNSPARVSLRASNMASPMTASLLG